jgi:hypothetical protein
MSAARAVLALVLTAVKALAVASLVPLVLMLVLHHGHQISLRHQMFTTPTRQ